MKKQLFLILLAIAAQNCLGMEEKPKNVRFNQERTVVPYTPDGKTHKTSHGAQKRRSGEKQEQTMIADQEHKLLQTDRLKKAHTAIEQRKKESLVLITLLQTFNLDVNPTLPQNELKKECKTKLQTKLDLLYPDTVLSIRIQSSEPSFKFNNRIMSPKEFTQMMQDLEKERQSLLTSLYQYNSELNIKLDDQTLPELKKFQSRVNLFNQQYLVNLRGKKTLLVITGMNPTKLASLQKSIETRSKLIQNVLQYSKKDSWTKNQLIKKPNTELTKLLAAEKEAYEKRQEEEYKEENEKLAEYFNKVDAYEIPIMSDSDSE